MHIFMTASTDFPSQSNDTQFKRSAHETSPKSTPVYCPTRGLLAALTKFNDHIRSDLSTLIDVLEHRNKDQNYDSGLD